MAGPLGQLGDDLAELVDTSAVAEYADAGGLASKEATLRVARSAVGADLSLSGMRRRTRLGVGYDVERSGLTVNLRPAGLWLLTSNGRRRARKVTTRKRGAAALGTPWGPRETVAGSTSPGKHTIPLAEEAIGRAAFAAIDEAITSRIGRL